MIKSVAELKKMVISASDLGEIINYFFDLVDAKIVSSSESYLTNKQIKHSNEIKSVVSSVEKTLSDFFKQKTKIIKPVLTYLPNEKLYHGIFILKENMFTPIIFFKDIGICIFCITNLNGSTDFFRLSFIKSSELKSPH